MILFGLLFIEGVDGAFFDFFCQSQVPDWRILLCLWFMSPYIQNKFLPFIIIISGTCSLWSVGPTLVIFFSTNNTTSETRWEVAKKVDNIVIWKFYPALRIYLCINTGIYFVLNDSAFRLRGLMEVGAIVDMRVVDGIDFLCMCE